MTRRLPGTMTLHGSIVTMLSSPFVWLMILLQVVAALLPDLISRAFRDTFSQLYRLQVWKGKKRKKVSTLLCYRLQLIMRSLNLQGALQMLRFVHACDIILHANICQQYVCI